MHDWGQLPLTPWKAFLLAAGKRELACQEHAGMMLAGFELVNGKAVAQLMMTEPTPDA